MESLGQKANRISSIHDKRYLILTLLLILFHLFFNLLWIWLNQNPLDFDPVGHTLISINSADYLKTHILNFNLGDYMRISPAYPNFVHLISLFFIFLFGNHWKLIELTGTLFFLITIFATYLYVRTISNNEKLAFLTALFYSFFISIVQYSRFHMLDIPLTAMIFLTLYLWEKLKKSGNYAYVYASAFTFAFAQLSKWHGIVFLFIPGVFLLLHFYKNKLFFKRSFIIHFSLCIIVIALLTVPWYYFNFANFLQLGRINYLGEPDDPRNLLSIDNVFFYARLISNFQTGFFGFVFLLFSTVIIIFKGKKYFNTPIATTVFAYLFFTFLVPNKNIRVIFPIMPFIALCMAFGLNYLIALRLKIGYKVVLTVITIFVPVYMFFAFFILSFGFPFKPKTRLSLNLPLFGWTDIMYLNDYPVNLYHSKTEIRYEALLQDILSVSQEKNRPVKVLVAVHQPFFHKDHLILALYTKYSQNISNANELLYSEKNRKIELLDLFPTVRKFRSLEEALHDVDVVLTTEKNPIHPEQTLDPLYIPIKQIQAYLLYEANPYSLSNSFSLENEDKLLLFKKM